MTLYEQAALMRLGLRFIHEHQLEAQWLGRIPTETEITNWQETREFRERLADETQLASRRNWMDDVLMVSPQGEVQIGDRVLSKAETDKLPQEQADFIAEHERMRELHTNVFRFYGLMDTADGHDTKRIDLEVEFVHLASDGDGRKNIKDFANAVGATLSLMSENHTDEGLELQVDVCLNVLGQEVADVEKVIKKWRQELLERELAQYTVSLL